jgi:hypothetical protein
VGRAEERIHRPPSGRVWQVTWTRGHGNACLTLRGVTSVH